MISPDANASKVQTKLFIRTKHIVQIFGVIPFIKLQTTLKQQLNSEEQ